MLGGIEHEDGHVHHVIEAGAGNAYLAAGVAGMGVLCLPQYMATRHVAAGELVRLLPEWRLAPMPLYLAYPRNRYVSTRLRVFIEWVVGLMEEHAAIEQRPRLRG
ncbi:MAG: LysR substrate-binding domain-containing protein [Massilia sp.]